MMSQSDVPRDGLRGKRPDREATTGVNLPRRWRGRHRGERPMVPSAQFTSYYGKPILNSPVWESPDIPGYLFLGGLAGGSSLLGPAVAAYTAALISNTAVPAWHDGYPEMPFLFTGSGMMAAGGLEGRAGRYMKAGKALAALGAAGAMLSRRSRVAAEVSGAALLAASAATRWGIYHAGMASASDPKYTVVPQRQQLNNRAREEAS
jgi:hypothetical protein